MASKTKKRKTGRIPHAKKNGHAGNGKARSNGHLSLTDTLKQRLGQEHGAEPIPDRHKDKRVLAELLSALAVETPERRRLFKKIGIEPGAIAPRTLETLSHYLSEEMDQDDASEAFDIPWDKGYENRDERPDSPGLNTRRLSDVVATEVEWLWPQRIPLGKLTLLSGDPDLGKTWVVLDIISRITTGRDFPDAAFPFKERRNALWVSGEDGDSDTIRPRIDMLDGDPNRVFSLKYVCDDNSKRTDLDLKKHIDEIDSWLAAHPLVTVIGIDPFAAFLGRTDSHNNSNVRGLLTPLTKMAEKRQVSIIGINHLSKGDGEKAMYRGMGSIAFNAAARSSWMVSKDPEKPEDRRLFLKVKNNLASDDVGGLAFRIGKKHNGISWERGKVETTADESLRPRSNNRAPARNEAKEWLQELLKDGPVPAADVWAKVKADGMCVKTIKLAKKELDIESKKTGGTGEPWRWSLPKGRTPKPLTPLPSLPPLNSKRVKRVRG